MSFIAVHQRWLDWIYINIYLLVAALFISMMILAIAGALGFYALKAWLKNWTGIKEDLTPEQVVIGIADIITNRQNIDLPTAQDRAHSLSVTLGLYFVRSVVMQHYFLIIGGTFTALIGMTTVLLLNEQNKKLDEQTAQIRLQSQANVAASILMEGTRRAALSAEQSALFAEIRDEAAAILKNDQYKEGRVCRGPRIANSLVNDFNACWRRVTFPNDYTIELVHLPNELTQRAIIYSINAVPYPVAERIESGANSINIEDYLSNQFIFPVLSPERGQLAQILIMNQIDGAKIKLESADLKGIDFSHRDIRHWQLSGSDMRGVKLQAALLSGTSLINANLSKANLKSAHLDDALLSSTNLSDADLSKADLSRADISNSNLRRADLRGSILFEAFLPDADARNLILIEANLTKATINRANLSESILTGASLISADLTAANLTKTIMNGANLTEAILTQANLWKSDLSGANLSGANLLQADLREAILRGANIAQATLIQANLHGVDLQGANLHMTDLRAADLTQANLRETILNEADLSGAKISFTMDEFGSTPNYSKMLDEGLRAILAPSFGLDTAVLPQGFVVSCQIIKVAPQRQSNACRDDGGWTINYVD